jgi:hypothetical protein
MRTADEVTGLKDDEIVRGWLPVPRRGSGTAVDVLQAIHALERPPRGSCGPPESRPAERGLVGRRPAHRAGLRQRSPPPRPTGRSVSHECVHYRVGHVSECPRRPRRTLVVVTVGVVAGSLLGRLVTVVEEARRNKSSRGGEPTRMQLTTAFRMLAVAPLPVPTAGMPCRSDSSSVSAS